MTPPLVHLDLAKRAVVLFGGGPAAADRARELVGQGAEVSVVSLELCEDLADLATSHAVRWVAEEPAPEQLSGAWLVSLRLDDTAPETLIAGWAEDQRIWCEGGAAASASTVHTARLGTQAVAVRSLEAADPAADRQVAARLVDAAVSGASLRRPAAQGAGSVVLVGGGPGDPELLTIRGRMELAAADVIVTDRLGPVELLSEIATGATIIDVGKQPYHHPIPQEEINRLLVSHAQAGKRVVRLKGGDPFLLGRGGEEVMACREAGVTVTVVPGVTSALAAPLAAGIPVTHRGRSTGVLVISGHDELEPRLLARWPGTIVVLMGMARLGELATALIGAGKDFETPTAVISKAWTPQQREVRGRLGDIHTRVVNAGLSNPAVIVIGSVVDVLGPDTRGQA